MPVSAPAGASVESVTAVQQQGYCDVTVTLAHPGANDHARVKVLLPDNGWNGRFQAVGGSGYAAGDFGPGLIQAMNNGYAAASTDAGVTLSFTDTSAWALTPDGNVNLPLLRNFASRSGHDLAIVGKEVTAKYYGRQVSYSYWNGCSTGGRQGYMEAQRYPDDFDGILANAPAINWDRFAVATQWPQVVQNQEHNFLTPCEFNAFATAAAQACDPQDWQCSFDPRRLIGKTIVCEGEQVTITAADAEVVRKIWDCPKPLWYGLPRTAAFTGLATQPFPISANWIATFLKQNPAYDTTRITYSQFGDLFEKSQRQYNGLIGTDSPDLTAFRKSGGKLLTWHGIADTLITPAGTVDYRERVEKSTRGPIDSFYRLFLAPGVAHCGSGTGPVPTDALGALVNWVEKGQAPDTLSAAVTTSTGTTITRNLCHYPQKSYYTGHGDPNLATNHRCH